MAKKRFTDNMDSLFGETPQETKETSMSLFPEEEKQRAGAKREADRKSGKDFAAQLDAILAEAFESTQEEAETSAPAQSEKKPRRKLPSRRATGLDLLIRRTGDEASAPVRATNTRRLTVALKKDQLDKLKRIAKDEGVYLKDLMNKLVDRYLEKYGK